MTVIATGFEGGNTYRPERTISTFSADLRAAHSQAQDQPPGAKIPPFLLNRQQGL